MTDGLDDQWHQVMAFTNNHRHKQVALHNASDKICALAQQDISMANNIKPLLGKTMSGGLTICFSENLELESKFTASW
jgi:uncharacterized protein (UPF0261 family)